MKPLDSPAFGWRADPHVPDFDDSFPLAVMDGDCALCCRGARMIHRADKSGEIRIAAAGSPLGRALMTHFGMNPDDPESWLFLEDGRAWTGFDGMARVGARCGGPLALIRLLTIPPRPVCDWLYACIARNRIAVFGRAELCAVPDPAFRARIIG